MQLRKLLLVRSPVKERKMLPGVAMPIITKQTEFHRRARVEDVDMLDLDRVEHPVRLFFRDGENDLHRLVIEPEHVRRVVRPRVPCSLCTVDDRCTMNAEVLCFMKQPFGYRMMTVAAILFGIESKLVAVHVCLR